MLAQIQYSGDFDNYYIGYMQNKANDTTAGLWVGLLSCRPDAGGVYNVQERLRMLYGSGYGITIESEPERYTRVYLRLPLKMGREETHCDEACID